MPNKKSKKKVGSNDKKTQSNQILPRLDSSFQFQTLKKYIKGQPLKEKIFRVLDYTINNGLIRAQMNEKIRNNSF